MNHEIKDEQTKYVKEDDLQKKCYPKRNNNQMPYQKIEFELRKDTHWPPITNNSTTTNNNNNNHIQFQQKEIANSYVSSRSNSTNHLNRTESSKKKHKLEEANFEMKITANDKLIYELDQNDIPIKMSPVLNDQFTKI